MRKSLLVLALLAFGATGAQADMLAGTGNNSAGGKATASIKQRKDGNYTLVLSVSGSVCTAVYDHPRPGKTELSKLTCSGGKSGNATVKYDDNSVPARVTFGGANMGSGVIRF